jgi:GNAT superfamily N-acetyltransferase
VSEAPQIRVATPADVDTLEAIALATEDPSAEPPTPAGAQVPYLAHLVSRGRVLLADRDGRVVAFGATIDSGRSTHLADLFVLPAEQGRGIGGRLLDALFAEVGRESARTTFASDDPRALPLYVRLGMRPLWPNLYLTGRAAGLPRPAWGRSTKDITLDAMAELERGWTGVDRGPDLDYWASVPEPRPFAMVARGSPIAVGLLRRRMRAPGLWLDHVLVAPDTEPLAPLLAAFALGADSDGEIGGCVPGPSPVLAPLLAAGFRIFDHDTFMASEVDLVDPEREVVNTGLL